MKLYGPCCDKSLLVIRHRDKYGWHFKGFERSINKLEYCPYCGLKFPVVNVVKCQTCGKDIIDLSNRGPKRKFCNHACRQKDYRKKNPDQWRKHQKTKPKRNRAH